MPSIKTPAEMRELLKRYKETDNYAYLNHFAHQITNSMSHYLDRIEEMEKALRRALDIIETGFHRPFDHLDGCLFKANPRMPCQCNPRGRIEEFRRGAIEFLDTQRSALPPLNKPEGKDE